MTRDEWGKRVIDQMKPVSVGWLLRWWVRETRAQEPK